tara:strand:+ start:96 stop:557 length:462 start_codon:yes stop_codon:yes gene_type:complete
MSYITQTQIPNYRRINTPDVCPILNIKEYSAVLDHDHKSGQVRGVVSDEANVLIGKIENFFRSRCAKSEVDLPNCLRNIAAYLEQEQGPLHPVGLRQLTKRFKKKKKETQIQILKEMNADGHLVQHYEAIAKCINKEQRAKLYREALKKAHNA